MLFPHDYTERVVDIFALQIQSGYYGVNWSVSIEGVALEHVSAPAHTETETTPQALTRYAVLRSFLSDNSKQHVA